MMYRSLALLAAALVSAAPAQEAGRKWPEALALFQRFGASKDPLERARAVEELGLATSEKHDKQCWQLAGALLRRELSFEGPAGKNEERISGNVLESCVGAFRKISSKEVVAEMVKAARNKADPPRFRAHVVWGLGPQAEEKDLTDFADDKIPHVQIAALDGLAARGGPAALQVFLRVLGEGERIWEVRLTALRGIDKHGGDTCIDPLIEALGRARPGEGWLRDQLLRTLTKLVGTDVGSEDPNAWRVAAALKKQGKDPAKPGEGATVSKSAEFYGLQTRSTRIVFVLDCTGSMEAPAGESPETSPALPPETLSRPQSSRESPLEAAARAEAFYLLKKFNERKVNMRIDAVRKQVIRTIFLLDPRVRFNVVWYGGNPMPWKAELVPATWENKLDCIKGALKVPTGGPTNLWDALETAFKMTALPQQPDAIVLDKKADYAAVLNGADTIFLMTDGIPNVGRIPDPEAILSELRKVNRLRRITIHTVCVGEVPLPGQGDPLLFEPPDPAFLKRIADETGGSFIHIKP